MEMVGNNHLPQFLRAVLQYASEVTFHSRKEADRFFLTQMKQHLPDAFIRRGILLATVGVTGVTYFPCEVGNRFDPIAHELVSFLILDDAE